MSIDHTQFVVTTPPAVAGADAEAGKLLPLQMIAVLLSTLGDVEIRLKREREV